MKNKKLLLKSIMVLSLIFAISCKSNSNPDDDTTTQTPSAPKKDPVAIDIATESKAASSTTLKMELHKTNNETKTPAEVTFTGTDATDATLTVSGFGLVTDDPENETGTDSSSKTWVALAQSDLSKDDIKLVKDPSGKYKVSIDNSKVQAIKAKVQAAKYTVIGVQVTATKEGKEAKDLTFYVVVVQAAN